MDEVTSSCRRGTFSLLTPPDFANAREDVRNRLLLPVMVNSGAGFRQDFEQSTPQYRIDAKLWCYRRQTLRADGLRRSGIELCRTDDTNWGKCARHIVHVLLPKWPSLATRVGAFSLAAGSLAKLLLRSHVHLGKALSGDPSPSRLFWLATPVVGLPIFLGEAVGRQCTRDAVRRGASRRARSCKCASRQHRSCAEHFHRDVAAHPTGTRWCRSSNRASSRLLRARRAVGGSIADRWNNR